MSKILILYEPNSYGNWRQTVKCVVRLHLLHFDQISILLMVYRLSILSAMSALFTSDGKNFLQALNFE